MCRSHSSNDWFCNEEECGVFSVPHRSSQSHSAATRRGRHMLLIILLLVIIAWRKYHVPEFASTTTKKKPRSKKSLLPLVASYQIHKEEAKKQEVTPTSSSFLPHLQKVLGSQFLDHSSFILWCMFQINASSSSQQAVSLLATRVDNCYLEKNM